MADRVVIYHWDQVLSHLANQLETVHRKVETAESDREMWRLQGRAAQLRELMNLPETLSALTE